MKELEVIGKVIEIYKIKIFLFVAIAGGSWIYILKFAFVAYKVIFTFVFVAASFGIFSNISKLSSLQRNLERLQND